MAEDRKARKKVRSRLDLNVTKILEDSQKHCNLLYEVRINKLSTQGILLCQLGKVEIYVGLVPGLRPSLPSWKSAYFIRDIQKDCFEGSFHIFPLSYYQQSLG